MGHFDTLAGFVAMEGHGGYVWACFLLASAVIIYNMWAPRIRRRNLLQEHAARLRRSENSSTAARASEGPAETP